MTQGQQDAVESQVAEGLRKCHDNIQHLQKAISSAGGVTAQPSVNYATVAHRQGVVGSCPWPQTAAYSTVFARIHGDKNMR